MKTLLKMAGVLAVGLMGGQSWANSPEAAPLPAVETVIERAVARAQQELENDAAFKANYSYTRSKTTEYRNIRGNLTKRKEKTNVNEPRVRRVEENSEAVTGNAVASTNTISSDASQNKRDLLANTNLVKRFTFELRGREVVDGHSTLVVDFKPTTPKLPASNLKERCLNKVIGRVWVDENEFVIVKAEARLTEGIGVVGGLIGSVHKFNFSFGRERTEDGLWYTRLLTWHLEMREVIVERIVDCVETKSEVRKAR
jgi:hypothetical protein